MIEIPTPNVLGAQLVSLTANKSDANSPMTYTIELVEKPGQRFRLTRISSGLFADVLFSVGSLNVFASVVGWSVQQKNISGTKRYSVTLEEILPPGISLKRSSVIIGPLENNQFGVQQPTEEGEPEGPVLPGRNAQYASIASFQIEEDAEEPNEDVFNFSASQILSKYNDNELISVEIGQSVVRPDFEDGTPLQLKSVYKIQAIGLPRINLKSTFGFTQAPATISVNINENGVTTTYTANNELKIGNARQVQTEDAFSLSNQIYEVVTNKPEPGRAVIEAKQDGPFYNLRRLHYGDFNPSSAGEGAFANSFYAESWAGVRNLSEPLDSPGYLLPGTIVTINFFSETELGPFVPFIEQNPQTFMPPLAEE